MRAALLRYRVMADIVGVALLVLVVVGMPLEYLADQPAVVNVLGPLHGLLYIVYLLAALDLSRRAHLRLAQMVAMAAAGFLPFLAFIVERRMTTRLMPQLAPSAEEVASEISDLRPAPGRAS
ncbi:MAG: DUF3817 domain-containing protein [Actinomycetota bacterium]|nr:DUF3817 domain-containing protein [Actinomycetota bacterium]